MVVAIVGVRRPVRVLRFGRQSMDSLRTVLRVLYATCASIHRPCIPRFEGIVIRLERALQVCCHDLMIVHIGEIRCEFPMMAWRFHSK